MDDRRGVGSFLFAWAHLRAHSPAADRYAADISRDGCAWPEASRTGLNAGTHAVKACALPFRAGRDRSRPAGYLATTDHITLSDREVSRLTRAEPPKRASVASGRWPMRTRPNSYFVAPVSA